MVPFCQRRKNSAAELREILAMIENQKEKYKLTVTNNMEALYIYISSNPVINCTVLFGLSFMFAKRNLFNSKSLVSYWVYLLPFFFCR
jgi:hypothetical protein